MESSNAFYFLLLALVGYKVIREAVTSACHVIIIISTEDCWIKCVAY